MEAIRIRAARPEDAEALAEAATQPGVVWGTLQLPASRPDQWRRRLEGNDPDSSYVLVAEVDGKAVALAALFWKTRPRVRHTATLGMFVHDAYQGRGIGKRLLAALVEAADRWLGLVRVELEVFPDNAPAVHLYESGGFVVEGRKRLNVWRDGAYVDSLLMARIRPDLRPDREPLG